MSDNSTDFFDGVGGGAGAPGALLKNPGDYVQGTIVEMFKRDYIPFGKKDPAKREDGTNAQQLVIILQTSERNWARVNKVPKVDPADESKGEKPPADDDGKRAVYVPENKNIQFAIGRAVVAAGAKPVVGGTLGVKITELKPNDLGNPQKIHAAVYKAPEASDGFFGDAPATPTAQATPAPAATPEPSPAPASEDPWASASSAPVDEPPF